MVSVSSRQLFLVDQGLKRFTQFGGVFLREGNRQHIVEGIESFPEAFRMLLRGENHGKLLLRPL